MCEVSGAQRALEDRRQLFITRIKVFLHHLHKSFSNDFPCLLMVLPPLLPHSICQTIFVDVLLRQLAGMMPYGICELASRLALCASLLLTSVVSHGIATRQAALAAEIFEAFRCGRLATNPASLLAS